MRNNIPEACRAFNEMLPDEKEEYLIKVMKPIAFYYDLKGNLVNNEINNIKSILDEFETLRIDIDSECQYRDLTGILRDKYQRANEMLDDCIEIVKKYRGY